MHNEIKSLQTAQKVAPELVKEIVGVCSDIYDHIAMDAFGINGATDVGEYVSVISDHLHWETSEAGSGLLSVEAKEFYNQRCTFRTQKQIVGSSFLG
tara:strand:+ start:395 stop:685 length:291 start_codon:yes stop_codon:yes gene_type:complete